jgi:hypothetical protein
LSLKVIHQGNENVVEDDTTALIGSDASATVRIVRPGISRKHAVVSNAGGAWKVEDAGSRNGTYKDGKRIQTLEIAGPTTLYLGHPTDGEAVSFVPVANQPKGSGPTSAGAPAATSVTTHPTAGSITGSTTDASTASKDADDDASFDLPATPPPAATSPPQRKPKAGPVPASGRTSPDRTRVQPTAAASAVDVELAQLTAAIRDQISAVKGLTWSVWAMIAVTAALIVLTLFVGILSN